MFKTQMWKITVRFKLIDFWWDYLKIKKTKFSQYVRIVIPWIERICFAMWISNPKSLMENKKGFNK